MTKLISLNELAKLSDVNKSRLAYYKNLGLLIPQTIVGRMQIFDVKTATSILFRIKQWQKERLSLREIKDKLDKKTN
jgi:DNA-binding transcriptional MerR regulator